MKVDEMQRYYYYRDSLADCCCDMEEDMKGDYVLYSEAKAIEEEKDKYYKKACAWQSNCEERDRQVATLTAETIQWKAAWQTEADGLKHADAEIERLERDKAILEMEIIKIAQAAPTSDK